MEKEIKINGKNTIYGTLAIPNDVVDGEKYPAVLLIAGSGPLDRDGNDRKGKFQTNLYKGLAQYMTNLGFVTFRYDKRGTGQAEGEWLASGLSDLVEDAQKSVEFLKSHPYVDPEKIIVCGHSEGAIIATRLAELLPLAGIMFLSGGVDNLSQALKQQRLLGYKELCETPGFKGWIYRKINIAEKGEKQAEAFMEKVRKTDKDIIKLQLFFKQPAKWFREHDAYDTREALKNVSCPVIAIHGDKDVNVDNEVLKELAGLVKGKSEYHIITNMEHGLRIQTEPKNILNVRKIFNELMKRPLHEEALEKIANWLVTNFKNEEVENRKAI
ncbi:alpha/beta hydrolase family protein [Pseudoneobacillus sp. C159]